LLAAAQALKASGIRVVLVTNGYINPEPLAELLPYIDAVSLDIKWAEVKTAKKLSGVTQVQSVFETAKTIFNSGKHLEIVTNIVDHYNDDLAELRKIAKFIAEELSAEVPWHLSRAFPCYKLAELEPTPLATIDKARQIGEEYGIKNIHFGNI
jgi:pyruvate formate lyase activating enzyme